MSAFARRTCLIIAGVFISSAVAHAASPHLTLVLPRGGERGTELQVHFNGKSLKDAQEILSYSTDLHFSELKVVNGDRIEAKLKIDADATLGEHCLRVRTASGISDLATFWVGPFPTVSVDPKKTPNQLDRAQKIDLNVTVEGLLKNEEVHYFTLTAKKGDRLSVEVEGMRLGGSMFDPAIELTDDKGQPIASADETALLKQDSFLQLIVPADGTYTLQIHDSAYAPNDARYRMHVGTFPRPHVIFPCGGEVGQTVDAEFIGDVRGPIKEAMHLPATMPTGPAGQPGGATMRARKGNKGGGGNGAAASTGADLGSEIPFFAEQDHQAPPSPNYFRLCPFPNVMQARPNQTAATATVAPMDPPLAFNGVIAQPGEKDFYRFKAKKGHALEINVYARRVRSPLDSVLTLYDAKGKQLANNDDTGGPDSYIHFSPPADGEYVLSVEDQLHDGGPEFVYRVELTPATPEVTLSIPPANQGGNGISQERQTIVVPRGNRYATLLRATRQGENGELAIEIPNLPPGMTMHPAIFAKGESEIPVVFEAAPDAPIGGKFCDLAGHTDGKKKVEVSFDQTVVLTAQAQTYYHSLSVDRLAAAVAAEAPFTIDLVPPKTPLPQGSTMPLTIKAQRKGNFKGSITVRLLNRAPGISGPQTVEIKPDQSEVQFPLTADGGAQLRTSDIIFLGSGNDDGTVWVSTAPTPLEVAAPLVVMKIQQTSVEQGQTAKVTADIEKPRFEGSVKVELLGVNGATVPPKEITPGDKSVTFEFPTDDHTAPGQQAGLFCRLTVTSNGETITQDAARGGILRVDRKAGAKKQ